MKNKIRNSFLRIFVALSLFQFASVSPAQPLVCAKAYQETVAAKSASADFYLTAEQLKNLKVSSLTSDPIAQSTVQQLIDFAVKHNLMGKIVQVGPANRKLPRLIVAIDVHNKAVTDDYIATFNLKTGLNGGPNKTLAVEFQKEVENAYVFGAVRTGEVPGSQNGVWRWGRDQGARTDWWSTVNTDPASNIKAYGHLIGVTEAEAKNIEYFLNNPSERGPCKSSNCIAWITGIELGKTSKNATEEERMPLFNALGVSRTIAHFEIARRLMHAANNRHVAIVAFVDGEAGLNTFKTRNDILTAEPKIPFTNVIRGLDFPDDSPVMQAIAKIPDGAKIFVPIAAGASPDAVTALIQNSPKLKEGYDVHLLVNGISEATLQKGIETTDKKFRVHSLFLGGNLRKLYTQGKVSVVPGYLSDFTRHVRDPNKPEFHYDAIIVRVSPKDANGRYSLGPNNDMIMTIIRNRPGIKIIAEVNPNIPFTHGENFLTEEQITAKFEGRSALAGPPVVPYTQVEYDIGKHLATLIPDKAILQIGIGNIFGGLPMGLQEKGRRGLQIFTEMFGDPLAEIMQLGIADRAETGFAYGSANLYNWLNHRQNVKFVETEYVNNPGRVADMDNFHAVNTALQVTLRGDVNATHGADEKRISSPGGQVEFMSGAARSIGGKAIIAIRSTAKNGTVSTIALDTYGGNITTPHESVTHVVTEYGVAVLAGKSESQRAVAMIGIAHPQFRQGLRDEALKRGIISKEEAQKIEIPQIAAQ